MHGAVSIRDDGHNKAFLAARPSTLQTRPMRFHRANEYAGISDSTAQQVSAEYPAAGQFAEQQQEEVMASDVSQTGARAANHQHRTQEKTLRRLAQNREAARKSRLRKKAYLQQLESSRIKLAKLEQDLQKARSQALFIAGDTAGGNITPGAAMFNMEYSRWLDENHRHTMELRGGLQVHLSDGDLRVMVDECLTHYDDIFRLKGVAAKLDAFHLITGMWITPAERCFLWMGGFKPSELLKILTPPLEPLTEPQHVGICNLQQSLQQTEEALSQGLEQLQQSLANTVASGSFSESENMGNHMGHMAMALGKLANLEGFIRQADNLRQETLHQMHRILTIRQAARFFLAIGEYYSRLRALSSLWSSRPRQNMNLINNDSAYPSMSDIQVTHQQVHSNFSSF